ncbi:hypothetical protein ACFE04_010619 [Oxalis oulophora]
MVRVSNGVFVTINCLSLLFGLSIIAYSGFIHFHRDHPSECEKVLQTPLLITGIFITFVSIMGLVGSCCRVNIVLILYLIVMFFLIVGMIVFTLFVFAVTNKGAGKAVSGQGFSEYKLGDYSNWLRNHFVNGKNWNQIRSCLVEAQVCRSLGNNIDDVKVIEKVEDFYKKNLSPVQSGCCKPPSECGFKYKNATFWISPPDQQRQKVDNTDCGEWSNHQNTLCYNCNSCKGGVLANIRKKWRNLALFNIVVILVTIIVYFVGCRAGRNNRDHIFKYRV